MKHDITTPGPQFFITEDDRKRFDSTYHEPGRDDYMHLECRGESASEAGKPCGNWEEQPVDMPLAKTQSFEHLGDEYKFKCNECGSVEVAVYFEDHADNN